MNGLEVAPEEAVISRKGCIRRPRELKGFSDTEAAVAVELGGENVSEVAVAVLEGDKIFLLLSSSFSSSSFCYRHRHRFLLHNESALPLL